MSEQQLKPCPVCKGPPDRIAGMASCLDAQCPVSESAMNPPAWNAMPRAADAEELLAALKKIQRIAEEHWDAFPDHPWQGSPCEDCAYPGNCFREGTCRGGPPTHRISRVTRDVLEAFGECQGE